MELRNMLKSSVILISFAFSFAHCQFYYNYEEERPDATRTETQEYDLSTYQYKPPSALNQQYIQPSNTQPENSAQTGRSRTRIRVRSRNYPPEENHNESKPANPTKRDQHTLRQERKRQRQRDSNYVEPIQQPRVYAPSVFEKIGLGEAPNGIYVPHDSLLNILKYPLKSETSSHVHKTPISVGSQIYNYAQPDVIYASNKPQQRFFVPPQSNGEDTRQQSFSLPVTRHQSKMPTTSRQERGHTAPSPQARSDDSRRQTRHRPRGQYHNIPEPIVDIDSYRESTDDIQRKEIQIMPKVEYAPVTVRKETRPTQNRRRPINRTQSTSAHQVYSPSIFENVALGAAPSGIYIPEDSLLNVLRYPSAGRSETRQTRRHNPLQTYNQPTAQDSFLPEAVEENEHQNPLPVVSPSPKRHAFQRTKQSSSTRLSERRGQQNEPEEKTENQRSNERRVQRINNNTEDFVRQPRIRQQTQRQQQTPAVARPQSQVSSRGQTFKEAKLALADLPLDTDEDGIPGEAGLNYPTLHVIPKTSFSCSQQSYNGYYADLETSCQVVHLCQSGGVKNSFLCPNGTIFSQEKFSCQWWYKVNCSDAPKFYVKNDELYKVSERKRN